MAQTKHDPRAAAEWLAAFAEPTRLAIVKYLATGAKTVTELARACHTEIVNVSHHLGVMKTAGILVAERDGRFQRYSLVGASATGAMLEVAHESGIKVLIPLL
jgi:ArsR family transcriptional regulator